MISPDISVVDSLFADDIIRRKLEGLSNEQKIRAIRKLVEMMITVNPDMIDGVLEVKILERREKRPLDEDCFSYYFKGRDAQEVTDEMTNGVGYCVIDEPEPGAYALYFNGDNPMHIAKVIENDRAISRWGSLHVYEHPIVVVPLRYGAELAFFKPKG